MRYLLLKCTTIVRNFALLYLYYFLHHPEHSAEIPQSLLSHRRRHVASSSFESDRTKAEFKNMHIIYSHEARLRFVAFFYPSGRLLLDFGIIYIYSRLSLSRIPRDSLKHFEISVPRHIRVERVRKTINWTTTFNKWIYVIWLLKLETYI